MADHTAGKLIVAVNKHLYSEGGSVHVAVAIGGMTRADKETCAANARRLAACWNICLGIDTKALEIGPGLAELLDAAAAKAAPDVLVACKAVIDAASRSVTEEALGELVTAILAQLNAAIAKAEQAKL